MQVVRLDDYRQQQSRFVSGPVLCVHCDYSHVAVRPHGATMLECPSCGAFGCKSLDEVINDIGVMFGEKAKQTLVKLIDLEYAAPCGGIGA